jgi:heterodisulfide reductase subunit A
MQMERLLAPTRPFNNILRPSDGKMPDKIAYIFLHRLSRPYGRKSNLFTGLLHVLNQTGPIAYGALPMADVSLYYINIRAFGKGYNEFYLQAKDMGARYIKGK